MNNYEFTDFAFISQQIFENAFQKGMEEGKQKINNNIYNDSYIEGYNQGGMAGLIQGQILILKILKVDVSSFENKLEQCKCSDDYVKLQKEIKQIYPLKGQIMIKKQSLDF